MTERHTIARILAQLRANWPEAATPETEVMLGLTRLNDIVIDSTDALLAGFGLTPAGFEVLVTLRAQPAPRRMTPTELYQAILVTSGGMSKVLMQLENDGWIIRLANTRDARSRFVQLTDAGAARIEAVMRAVGEQDRVLLSGALSAEQVARLARMLLSTLDKLETGADIRGG